ncbi:MAG: WD40 repeat domain-containing protein [Chitinophagaceae bacterium]
MGRRHRRGDRRAAQGACRFWVTSVAFSPDGRRIVSGSVDHTLRLWDAATGAAIGEPLKGHSGSVRSVAFSPDGRRIVSGSYDNTLRLWDAATGAAIGEPLKGHTGWVTSVAFSPDGRRIVSGSADNTLRLWDATTGAAIGEPLKGHTKRGHERRLQPRRPAHRLRQLRQTRCASGRSSNPGPTRFAPSCRAT